MGRLRLFCFFHIIALLFVQNSVFNITGHAKSTEISKILDTLVDNATYDRRVRPHFNEHPLTIVTSLRVSGISSISEVNMDFAVDFYIRQRWNDQRLAFLDQYEGYSLEEVNAITVGLDYLSLLWKPDTFFPNSKITKYHVTTTPNIFLRIDPEGNVYTSERLTVTAVCQMDLRLFPLDTQKCRLEIKSYGHAAPEIVYSWVDSNDAVTIDSFEDPQFMLAGINSTTKIVSTTSGDFSVLICIFLFKRNIGFYLFQLYLPSVLIVVMSWISFWLDHKATPARVTLGVFTVLTMTTLISTTNSGMPKVEYFKCIDIFLGVSFLLVFSALVEYAAVNYFYNQAQTLEKRRQKKVLLAADQRLRQVQHMDSSQPSTSGTQLPVSNNCLYYPFYSSHDENSSLHPNNLRIPVRLKEDECQCPIPPRETRLQRRAKVQEKEKTMVRCCSGHEIDLCYIDQYSRFVFPLIFAVFNCVYWIYFYSTSKIGVTESDY